MVEADLDFTVGGEYRIRVQTETFGELTVQGRYEEIVEPEKVISWDHTKLGGAY